MNYIVKNILVNSGQKNYINTNGMQKNKIMIYVVKASVAV